MAEGDEKIDLLVSSVEEWVVSALKGEVRPHSPDSQPRTGAHVTF